MTTEVLDHIEIKASIGITETGEIEGLAWPFGTIDQVGDSIERGAFDAPSSVAMYHEHDPGETIGVWSEITETTEGLRCKGKLLIHDVPRARKVADLIRSGEIGGLSIGFITKSAQRTVKGRTIRALSLREISVVKTPCNEGARVVSLKSAPTLANGDHHPMEEATNQAQEAAHAANAPQIDTKAFDAVKARLDALEAKAARPGAHVTGPSATTEQKAFRTFLRTGAERLDDMDRKALTVAANANGGFLAPVEFSAELLKLLNEFSPVRQHARVVSVEAPELVFPRRVSGTAAAWTDEAAAATESTPVYEQVKIANHELTTFVDVSRKLLEDNAYNLEGELLADFAESFGKSEGLAFVKGTGVAQPRGIMTATGIKTVKTGVAAAFPTANPADVLIGMYHQIPTAHAHNAVWMMNRATLATVRTWKDAQGRYLVIDPQDGAPSQLLGRPVVEMPDMDNIAANTFPIMFGDLGGYRITDRVGLSVLHDPYTQGTRGMVRFIARKRVGADLTHPDRFVKLQVAA